MVLVLNNEELESVVDMPSCVDALYNGVKAYARGDAARRPRIDLFTPTSRPEEFACFSSMDGVVRGGYYAIRIKPDIVSWPEMGGLKRRVTYCYKPGLYGGIVLLFRTENAELVAIMNDGFLQHMRVGATAALGAKYLSRSDAGTVGMLGSGGMARSFASAFAAARKIQKIKVYSPNAEHARVYCREMGEKLDIDITPAKNPEDAVSGSDIVASCTNSIEPTLDARWLEPGIYLANVSNRELSEEVLRRITLVGYLVFEKEPLALSGFSDDNFELRAGVMAYVAGQAFERDKIPQGRVNGFTLPNARWMPCVDWKSETQVGRQSDDEIAVLAELASTFPSGLASSSIQGIQFASVAGRAYELASARGLGKTLDRGLFLQDIPT